MNNTLKQNTNIHKCVSDTFNRLGNISENYTPTLKVEEVGTVTFVGKGIARIRGLPNVQFEEIVRFENGQKGIVFNLEPQEVAVVLLEEPYAIESGNQVYRTHRVMDVAVGDNLLGRVINPLGIALDNKGQIRSSKRQRIEPEAPAIMDRAPVSVPLQTGIQVVDALIPIGRGQRQLILGDRQTGKTAIAVDTIINQKEKDVICIYCSIGKQSASVGKVIEDLKKYKALDYTIVIVSTGEDTPGLNFIAPYAATTIGEYFMKQGKDVLVVYDDLTRHARSYRELSLLLRRPPAREAYPGDIFYIHSRLLERSTHLNDELNGGSLTALPIIETQAQNVSAYIPTNLISITDGQIYLSPKLFQEGVLPAVDVGTSVSRVGGKTQLKAYREVAGDLRLSYSQFEELETFARFGTKLDEKTKKTLARGERVREVLKQSQYKTLSSTQQIAVLLGVTEGLFDEIELGKLQGLKNKIYEAAKDQLTDVAQRIEAGEKLKDEDRKKILEMIKGKYSNANHTDSSKED